MDIERARQLAKDETTSSDILRELTTYEDREILRSVAANSNTPTEILLRLGMSFPEEFLSNSILDLLILENPDFIDRNYYLQIELAKNERTSLKFLEYLMQYGRYGVRKYIALNLNTSVKMLEKMTEEAIEQSISGDETTKAIAKSRKTPTHILEEILIYWSNIKIDPVFFRDDSRNLEIELGINLASHPNTSKYILENLANSKRKQILLSVAKNTKTSDSILYKIVSSDHCDRSIKEQIINHPNVTEDILNIISINEN